MKKFIAGITSLVFVFNILSCSSLPIAEETQKEIFRSAKDTFFKKNTRDDVENWKLLQDKSLTKYVTKVGEKVRAKTDSKVVFLEYAIIDTPMVQAVSEGLIGRVNITLGMLNLIQNEAELACLLGHEIQHQVQANEETPKKDPNRLLKEAYDQFSPNQLHGLGISQDLEDISYANYSKSKETEADEQGSALCRKAGYNPFALSKLQLRIARQIQYSPIDQIKNLKGTHDQIEDRSEHLRKWLTERGYKESDGITGEAEYSKAFQSKKLNLTDSQKAALKKLSHFEKEIHTARHSLSERKIIQISSEISKIVQQEKVSPQELYQFYFAQPSGDHFLQERVINPLNRYRNAHEQILSQVFCVLDALGRISIGFTPLGAVIDFHDLVTGRDFFSGEKLSYTQRALSAVGLLVGQGQNLRRVEGLVSGLSGEARSILRAAEKIASSEAKPVLGSRYIRSLSDLRSTEKAAFEGHIFQGPMKPGDVVFHFKRT